MRVRILSAAWPVLVKVKTGLWCRYIPNLNMRPHMQFCIPAGPSVLAGFNDAVVNCPADVAHAHSEILQKKTLHLKPRQQH